MGRRYRRPVCVSGYSVREIYTLKNTPKEIFSHTRNKQDIYASYKTRYIGVPYCTILIAMCKLINLNINLILTIVF